MQTKTAVITIVVFYSEFDYKLKFWYYFHSCSNDSYKLTTQIKLL